LLRSAGSSLSAEKSQTVHFVCLMDCNFLKCQLKYAKSIACMLTLIFFSLQELLCSRQIFEVNQECFLTLGTYEFLRGACDLLTQNEFKVAEQR
jgi:hypothetical protein